MLKWYFVVASRNEARERGTGMSSLRWTKEAILQDAKENDVRFIRLMFTDILGIIKNVEIPLSQLPKALDGKIAFDGSSIDGFVRIEESDMYLSPDYDSWLVFNWHEEDMGRVARLVCDVYTNEHEPFLGDPRTNLKRVLREMEAMGFSSFCLGSEPEFFLFKLDEEGRPTMEPHDAGGYFDLAPMDRAESTRREIVLELENLGFEIEASHHENAPGQQEIDWKYASAIDACDQIQTFKIIVKTVAARNDLHATFMPKPLFGVAGSGMHCNLSLHKGNENAFNDPDDELGLSQTAYHFIGGLLKYAREYTAICNPLVNSYKRLVAGFEAPVYVAWSLKNRSPLIRLPSTRGKATRIEVRSVDSTANPYLALAVLLSAGLQGIKDEIDPGPPVQHNLYAMTTAEREALGIKSLPSTLDEALNEFRESDLITTALGNHIKKNFLYEKGLEVSDYNIQVTPWELEKYLHIY